MEMEMVRVVDATPPDIAWAEGVPNEVVAFCEGTYSIGRAAHLEAMRRVRDALAPYTRFKEFCEAHGENYEAIRVALSRAYGDVAPDTRKVHGKREENAAFSNRQLSAPERGPRRRKNILSREEVDRENDQAHDEYISEALSLMAHAIEESPEEKAAYLNQVVNLRRYLTDAEHMGRASEVLTAWIKLIQAGEAPEPEPSEQPDGDAPARSRSARAKRAAGEEPLAQQEAWEESIARLNQMVPPSLPLLAGSIKESGEVQARFLHDNVDLARWGIGSDELRRVVKTLNAWVDLCEHDEMAKHQAESERIERIEAYKAQHSADGEAAPEPAEQPAGEAVG